jgi:hypothetical protein
VASKASNCPACCELLSTNDGHLFYCACCNKYYLIAELSVQEANALKEGFANLVSQEEYDRLKNTQ